MDILGEYEKNQPQMPVKQPSYGNAAPSEGLLIRMVMKLSGGNKQNRRQALIVLLVAAGVGLLAAVVLIFQSTGVTRHPIIKGPPPQTQGRGLTQ